MTPELLTDLVRVRDASASKYPRLHVTWHEEGDNLFFMLSVVKQASVKTLDGLQTALHDGYHELMLAGLDLAESMQK